MIIFLGTPGAPVCQEGRCGWAGAVLAQIPLEVASALAAVI